MNALEEFIHKLRGSSKQHEVELAERFPPEKIEQIKRKELRRFREAQDKKWQNWFKGISR